LCLRDKRKKRLDKREEKLHERDQELDKVKRELDERKRKLDELETALDSRQAKAASAKRASRTARRRLTRATSTIRLNPRLVEKVRGFKRTMPRGERSRSSSPATPSTESPSAQEPTPEQLARKRRRRTREEHARMLATIDRFVGDEDMSADLFVRQLDRYLAGGPRMPLAVQRRLYQLERTHYSECLEEVRNRIFSDERLHIFHAVSKESDEHYRWHREFFETHFNGVRSVPRVILPGRFGHSPVYYPRTPGQKRLKAIATSEARDAGLEVTQLPSGRIATTDFTAAAHRLQEQAEQAGLLVPSGGGRGDGCTIFVLSSDAAKMAGTGKVPNWTSSVLRVANRKNNCELGACLPLYTMAGGDNNANLRAGLEPNMPALDMICVHNVLFCCKERLRIAHQTCICLAADNFEVNPNCKAIETATACKDCCKCSRDAWTPTDLVVVGDLHNLQDMDGQGSVHTDPAHNSLHVVGVDDHGGHTHWEFRTPRDHALLAHTIPGEECPACGFKPADEAAVKEEIDKRAALPAGQERSEVLRRHSNVLAPRVLRWLPTRNMLFGMMHLTHNLFDQFMAAVWFDAKQLYKGTALKILQWEYITVLRAMGCGIAAPKGDRGAEEQEMLKLKGPDLTIIRTTLGLLSFLHLVYGLLDEVGGTPKPSKRADAKNKATAKAAAKRVVAKKRRLREDSQRAAEREPAGEKPRRLKLACKALAAFFRVVELLKDTEWDDSTPELRAERAQEYLQAFDVSTERAPAHSHSRLWLCALTPSPQRPPSLYLPPALTGNVPTYPA